MKTFIYASLIGFGLVSLSLANVPDTTQHTVHMLGADISTITGSGIMYRAIRGNYGFKVSGYLIAFSKNDENDYNLGAAVQRTIITKPLTRLYFFLAGYYGGKKTENYHYRRFNGGLGFGAELRAFQAVKNEDTIFFIEVGEKYLRTRQERLSSGDVKSSSGYTPCFTAGLGIEF